MQSGENRRSHTNNHKEMREDFWKDFRAFSNSLNLEYAFIDIKIHRKRWIKKNILFHLILELFYHIEMRHLSEVNVLKRFIYFCFERKNWICRGNERKRNLWTTVLDTHLHCELA